jgi:hypothetical protein
MFHPGRSPGASCDAADAHGFAEAAYDKIVIFHPEACR